MIGKSPRGPNRLIYFSTRKFPKTLAITKAPSAIIARVTHKTVCRNTFSCPILPKKKIGKMAIFEPKPWVNPFGKISIFRLFELVVFIAEKGVFSF